MVWHPTKVPISRQPVQKSERPELMFREVHSVAHRSRMTVAVPMRDVLEGDPLVFIVQQRQSPASASATVDPIPDEAACSEQLADSLGLLQRKVLPQGSTSSPKRSSQMDLATAFRWPDQMPHGDCPAVRVQSIGIEPQLLRTSQCLRQMPR